MNNYWRHLQHFYTGQPALYELDDSDKGFRWINGGDSDRNMLTFCRMTKDRKNCLMFHFNFSPVEYKDFRSGVLCPGEYVEVFNNSREEYGGRPMLNEGKRQAEPIEWDGKPYSIEYDVPAFGMVVFQFDYTAPSRKKRRGSSRRKRRAVKE